MVAPYWEARPGKCWNVMEAKRENALPYSQHRLAGDSNELGGQGSQLRSLDFWIEAEPKGTAVIHARNHSPVITQHIQGPTTMEPWVQSHIPAAV